MFTLNDILQSGNVHIQSAVTPETDITFQAAHHDSRQIHPGDLFVALKGERVDGHSFIPAVAKLGARGALCSAPVQDVPPEFIQIVVPDVVKALQATAHVRASRQQGTTFIGITGSNGKTSTKEAVAAVLGLQAPTLKTQASYNNEIGYPLTLLRLAPEHRYAVLEMGAQWVGELAWLCKEIARPDWSFVTSVGAAHLEYFGSQERIAIAKAELVEALTPDGLALLNYDDPIVRRMAEKTKARVLYYGQSTEAEVQALSIGGDALFGYSFTLSYQGKQVPVQLRMPGSHGISIALAAAAAGCAAHIPLDQIAAALETLPAAKGRGEIKSGPHGSTLIDDTYNASRQSILAITRAMRNSARAPHGKRWAVLGDIFELGKFAQAEHYTTGEALAEVVDCLIAVGDQARFYIDGALAAGMPKEHTYYFRANVMDSTELADAKRAAADVLRREVQHDDLVLLKGSRGMRMETILDVL